MLIKEIIKEINGKTIKAQFKSNEALKINNKPVKEKYRIEIGYEQKTFQGAGMNFTKSVSLHWELINNKAAGLQSMKNIMDRIIAEQTTGFQVQK
jgi:hypothetical protein